MMSSMMMMEGVKFAEVVADDEDDDVVPMMTGEEEEAQEIQAQEAEQESAAGKVNTPKAGQQILSKSWTIGSAHVPTFTGGKVTHSYSNIVVEEKNDDEDEDDKTALLNPFLLLPVHGDLAIVDAMKGIKLGTVRGGSGLDASGENGTGDDVDNDDDEDEGVDQESITSYALDHKNQCIVTCSRNNMLKQYSVIRSSTKEEDDDGNDDDEDEEKETSVSVSTTTKLVQTWGRSGHRLPVTIMAYHDSDIFLATGSVDGTVRIWDVRGRYVTHVFRPLAATNKAGSSSGRVGITSIKWKPGTSQLIIAIGREDGSISIHNLRDGSPDEKTLNNSSIILLNDHLSGVTCMDWWSSSSSSTTTGNNDNNDGSSEFFITTGRDSILNLWRIVPVENEDGNDNKGKKKKNKRKQKKDTTTTPPQQPRVMYRRIQTIPVYEQIEGMIVLSSSSTSQKNDYSNESNNNNEIRIVTAGSKGLLRKWKAEVTTGQTPELVQTSEQPISESFGDNRGGYMGLLLQQPQSQQQSSAQQQQQSLIAVDAEHNLSFVNYSTLTLNRTIVGHNDEVLDLKIIPSMPSSNSNSTSTSIVVATNSPQVRVFDLNNFSCSVLDGHTSTVLCVDASPCGRYVASCGKDKTLRLWMNNSTNNTNTNHTPSYKCVGIATGHTEPIGACGLSQKTGRYEVGGKAARNGGGAFCITASVDKTLKRWNLLGPDDWNENDEDGGNSEPVELEAVMSIRGHDKDINIISIAPNDSIVASGSQDKTVKLWNCTDLSLKATLKGHRRGVWDCQFSPIDRVVATSSGDKTIKIWSLGDYSCVRTFQGHLSSVLRVRFLSTGLQLVSSGADGLVKLWTIRTNECESTLDGHSNKVWALDLAPSNNDNTNGNRGAGDIVVSGAADSKILVWEDTTAQLEDEERAEEAERILLDQKMVNHLRHKEYDKALDIALQVDKPRQALKVLNALLENEITASSKKAMKNKQQHPAVVSVLQKHCSTWDLDRIAQVLKYCREWNTRARNSSLAMWVLQAIVTTISVDRLTSKDATETKHGSIPEILAGITPYAERHFERFDRLHTNTYLLDYLLVNMSSLDPILTTTTNNKDDDEHDNETEFALWESKSKLVLPPKFIDGRIQMGGQTVVGSRGTANNVNNSSDDDDDEGHDSDDDSDDDVMTVGDSSSSESEDDEDNE